ncbi:MAG: ABC transporter substrate-binding protein [Solirubrobacteraceae bacterium]
MKKYLCASLVLVLAVVLTACGGGNNRSGGSVSSGTETGSSKQYAELRWGFMLWPGPIDNNKDSWFSSISIQQLVVQSLMELEADGKVTPGLASSVEQPTPTTYIYNLKHGVRFSDGKPLTPADVVYSLKRNILDKEAWTTGYWEDVASISARGQFAVVVKLKRPNAVWEYNMAISSPIIEKAQGEKDGEKALGSPSDLLIGTGPWKFDSFTPETSVRLSRNPYWTGATPPAKNITISIFKNEATMALALRSGAIDGAFGYQTPKTFANIPGTRQLTAPGNSLVSLAFNTASPPFNDVHLRRAISYAADANGIIKAIYPKGEAVKAVTITPTAFFDGLGPANRVNEMLNSLPKYEFNLAVAKRELAKSAYPHGLTMSVQAQVNEQNSVAVAQIVATNLAKIGITANIQEIQPDETGDLFGSKVKVLVGELIANYPDPENLMAYLLPSSQIRPPGSGTNQAEYRNAEVDKLQLQELETLNRPRRLQLIGKLLKIVGAEVPYMPLYTHDVVGTLSEKYVFPAFSAWTVEWRPWAMEVKLAP